MAGILGDRWSRPKIVVGSLAMWSTFTILSGLAPNRALLLVCRLIGSGVTLEATRIASMFFGCSAGFIVANQAPSAFAVVTASQRASAIGVLNLVGATVSGFAPFLGGMVRKTIGVGQLMLYTSENYMATGGLVLYAIPRHFERDHGFAEARFAQEL